MGVFFPIFYDLVQISELLSDFKTFIYKFCYLYLVFFWCHQFGLVIILLSLL